MHTLYNVNGDVAQMVEHFLSMEGAVGSMPTISTFYTQQMDRIHVERKERKKIKRKRKKNKEREREKEKEKRERKREK